MHARLHGISNLPPESYESCGVLPIDCSSPEDCHLAQGAGFCVGGPCLRSDPTRREEGQLDPLDAFHPKGDFKDTLGNLHRCEETCVDQDGWGMCKECGTGFGQTMLGCSCDDNNDCGADLCWGMDFPNGGFCWPASGPPNWQCEQGACGQSIRDENDPTAPVAQDGSGYCEHYSPAPKAHCQPQRCGDIQVQNCAESNAVCALTSGDFDCTPECLGSGDCQLAGWPAAMGCGPDQKCTF